MRLYVCVSLVLLCFASCRKQDTVNHSVSQEDSLNAQINYLLKIKASLKDSLSAKDVSDIDFQSLYKSQDYQTKNFFIRIGFKKKNIASDFVLLMTDKFGNILRGRIVQLQENEDKKASSKIFKTSSLNRKETRFVGNKSNSQRNKTKSRQQGNSVSSSSVEGMVAENQLPDVIVTGYITTDQGTTTDWYMYSGILSLNSMATITTYTYGAAGPHGEGGSVGTAQQDETIDISYENADNPRIDVSTYLKCFSSISNTGATFKITICSDIPVNGDPNKLFDFSTGACGHTFLQLYKSNGSTIIQQNIGFYPESGWKSIEANGPVTSKIVDNAGHEYNASLTVSVDATQFQNALNEIEYLKNAKYDIDNFNCTDFALSVFNTAAPLYLSIPQYHIPGGMYGELSNTPQGVYNELVSLNSSGGYAQYGQITVPGVAGYVGSSHGACN